VFSSRSTVASATIVGDGDLVNSVDGFRQGNYGNAAGNIQNVWKLCMIQMMAQINKGWGTALRLEGVTDVGLATAYDRITVSDEALLHLVIEYKLQRWVSDRDQRAQAALGGNVENVPARVRGRQANNRELTSATGIRRYFELFQRVQQNRANPAATSWKDEILAEARVFVDLRIGVPAQRTARPRRGHQDFRIPVG
jgi:hypothetical protein